MQEGNFYNDMECFMLSHRMKHHLVRHVRRRISLIKQGQRKNEENYT